MANVPHLSRAVRQIALVPRVGVTGAIIFFEEQLPAWIALGGPLVLAGVTAGGGASAATLG
jgi:hypothetical protein